MDDYEGEEEAQEEATENYREEVLDSKEESPVEPRRSSRQKQQVQRLQVDGQRKRYEEINNNLSMDSESETEDQRGKGVSLSRSIYFQREGLF